MLFRGVCHSSRNEGHCCKSERKQVPFSSLRFMLWEAFGDHLSRVAHCPASFLCDTSHHLKSPCTFDCLHGCASFFSLRCCSMRARIYSLLFATEFPGMGAMHAMCSNIYQLVYISWMTKTKSHWEHTLEITGAGGEATSFHWDWWDCWGLYTGFESDYE